MKNEFDFDKRNNFSLTGGQNSKSGKVGYRVVTNSGGGEGWFTKGKQEDHYLNASGRSVEALGGGLQKSKQGDDDVLTPAKLIKAKNGDIVLDADNGDIILKGDNIFIQAKGLVADNDGFMYLSASQGTMISSPDTRVCGTNLRLQASSSISIVGKTYGEWATGFAVATAAADFGGSALLSKLKTLLKTFEAFC